ncbi:MAG: glycosyltransferase [Shinella sp.]|nr:glycosyltransferase [Shinella sp.]
MRSIDVVIPNYNYGHFLEGCVRSVLNQGIADTRILIIDNASTDDSQRIAHLLAFADPRIELRLRTRNLGPHASFNEGVDWARAGYFLILCADDLLVPNALGSAIDVMEQHPGVDLAYGEALFLRTDEVDSRIIDPQSPVWSIEDGHSFIERLCRFGGNPISGPTVVVRTRAQKQAGHYNPRLAHTDDLEMWLRIAARGHVARTRAFQAVARVHPSNQSASVGSLHQWNLEFEAAFVSFFEGEGAAFEDAQKLLKMVRHSLSDRSYWSAFSSFLHREPGAWKLLMRAIQLRPTAAILPPLGHLWRKRAFMMP